MAKERESTQSKSQPSLARRENVVPSIGIPFFSPFGLMRRFMEEFERMGAGTESSFLPALEIFERDGQLIVRADVPGLDKDQINIEVVDNQLVISGERNREEEERGEGVYRSERSYGSFCRTVTLPEGIDVEKGVATFNNGVLEISMPAPRRSQSKRIEIREGSTAEQQTSSEGQSQPSAPESETPAIH